MNTPSDRNARLAILCLAPVILAACSLDSLRGGLSVTPEAPHTTHPAVSQPVVEHIPLKTTLFLATDPSLRANLAEALTAQGYIIKDDPTLAILTITTGPVQHAGKESTSAPLIGILRQNTRTDSYDIPFTIEDPLGNPLHHGTVVGFGDETPGIYPRVSPPNTAGKSKAKTEAAAQLPAAILQGLSPLPWRAMVIGGQDSTTVIIGADASTGLKLGQIFRVVGQPEKTLKITGFGAFGRALATPEKGGLPLPGEMIEPAQ